MALNVARLSPIFYGSDGRAKRWMYETTDTLATVVAAGYFDSHGGLLGTGDIIDVVVVDAINPSLRSTASAATIVVMSGA